MTVFRNIAIIGVGVIGGSLGFAIKRKISGVNIFGISRRQTLDKALSLGAIDQGFERAQMDTCLPKADLVFICAPIQIIIDMMPKVANSIQPGTLVTDVGSTKQKIVERAADYFKVDKYFLGGHPMAGNEGRGVEWADAFLFENTVYVLTPSQQLPISLTKTFGNLLEQIGAKVLFLSPSLHDKVAAAVSHLPQLVAVTLMDIITKNEKEASLFLKLAAGGFRDMTRIASSPYDIWKDIFETNRDEVCHFLDIFLEALKQTKENLNKNKLSAMFDKAARNRLSIPRDTKGFLRSHYDLSVWVEDKPGVIADISTALANDAINIKDIEVLKVREGDAGTIRLSFESEEARQKAQTLLKQIGYNSQKRN